MGAMRVVTARICGISAGSALGVSQAGSMPASLRTFRTLDGATTSEAGQLAVDAPAAQGAAVPVVQRRGGGGNAIERRPDPTAHLTGLVQARVEQRYLACGFL